MKTTGTFGKSKYNKNLIPFGNMTTMSHLYLFECVLNYLGVTDMAFAGVEFESIYVLNMTFFCS